MTPRETALEDLIDAATSAVACHKRLVRLENPAKYENRKPTARQIFAAEVNLFTAMSDLSTALYALEHLDDGDRP